MILIEWKFSVYSFSELCLPPYLGRYVLANSEQEENKKENSWSSIQTQVTLLLPQEKMKDVMLGVGSIVEIPELSGILQCWFHNGIYHKIPRL